MNFLLEIYRYLQCFAVITAEGGFTERFLNLCNRENVHLWDVTYESKYLKAKIYCKDFYKLKDIRRKSGVKIKIKEKHGLKFTFKAHNKRRVLFYGLLLALVFMYSMNQFVWFINVSGAKNVNQSEVISAAKQLGLDKGTLAAAFDKNDAGRKIVNLYNGKILWASVNIKGSKAVVEIREHNEESTKHTTDEMPCNIIADFDGVIVSNETYSGISCIDKGSAVRSGDILISGISENSDGSVNFHTAKAKLTARHSKELSYEFKYKNTVSQLSKAEKYCTLNVFSITFPLSTKAFSSAENRYEYTESLVFDGHIFPFSAIKGCSLTAQETKQDTKDPLFFVDGFTEYEYQSMKNTKILKREYNTEKKEDGFYITAEYECIDYIGKKSDILKEN